MVERQRTERVMFRGARPEGVSADSVPPPR